jgi:hypothetical protein
VRSRLTLLLLAALVAVPVATAATSKFTPERQRLNPADVRLAKKVALKRADLGAGWTAFTYGEATADDDSLSACPGFDLDLSAYTITGKAAAAFRTAGGTSVSSAVEVYASRAQAAGDFRAATTHAKLLDCVRASLEKSLREEQQQGLTMDLVSIARRSFPRVGERTFAFRTVTRVAASGVSVNVYVDSVSFQRGRTIVSVTFISALRAFGGQATLAKKLAARAA